MFFRMPLVALIYRPNRGPVKPGRRKTAILPPVPHLPNRAGAGALFRKTERKFGQGASCLKFSAAGSPPHLASGPAPEIPCSKQPLYQPLLQPNSCHGKEALKPVARQGWNCGNAPKKKRRSFLAFKKRMKNPDFFTHCACFPRSGRGLVKSDFKENGEAVSRESSSQHVLRTGIPKPPPALPRF